MLKIYELFRKFDTLFRIILFSHNIYKCNLFEKFFKDFQNFGKKYLKLN